MPVTTSGIGSGINIRELVDEMLAAEGQAKTVQFDNEETKSLAKITAFGSLKSSISEFQATLTNLSDVTKFKGRLATSKDTDIFTASATDVAAPGTYSIEVTQLAQKHKVTSANFASADTVVGTGTLKFSIGTKEHSIGITSENNTVKGIMQRINETTSTTGITATIITSDSGSQLVLTATEEGTDSIFTMSITSDGDGNTSDNAGLSQLDQAYMTVSQAGLDSIVNIDGSTVTSSSNKVVDAIEGVTLDLIETNVGDPKNLTVTADRSSTITSIQSFVDSYNALMDTMNELKKVVPDNADLSGALVGDATLRSLEIQIRREISERVSTIPGGVTTLAEVGITSNRISGKMELNLTDLNQVLDDQFDTVALVFAKSDEGVAIKLDGMLENYAQASGIIDTKTDGLNKTIDSITDRREQLERYLQNLEARLLSQFIAMDGVVAGLRSTSDFLTQQLSNAPDPLSYKK